MNTVILTCCPSGNLEDVLLILRRAGIEQENNAFMEWHDRILGPPDSFDPRDMEKSLPLATESEELAADILPERYEGNLLLADSRCLWTLDFWAAKLPEAKFLLFYCSAEFALASACRHGVDPRQALDRWQVANRQLLKFQRRHRRQSLLLDVEGVIRQPQPLPEICRRIGLTLQPLVPAAAAYSEQTDLERYLAHHLLANNQEVADLQSELEASAHPIGDAPSFEVQPLELLSQQSKRLVQKQELQRQLDHTLVKLRNAEQALVDQNAQLQELYTQIDQLHSGEEQEKVIGQQQAQIENLQQSHTSLETRQKETAQENELLLLQLHQVQEELEQTFLQRQELEQQKEKDRVALRELQGQIEQMAQSGEEREKVIGRQQAQIENLQQSRNSLEITQKETVQENELLLLQLHQVQEELEQTFLQKQELEQQREKALATQKQLKQRKQQTQKELRRLETASRETSQENELLVLHMQQVQEELEKNILQKQQVEKQLEQLGKVRDEKIDVTKENKSLRQELYKVQEELESVLKLKDQIDEELRDKERTLKKYQRREADLKHSMSWKITAPVRVIGKPFKKFSKEKLQTREQIKLIKESGLFDEEWYTANNEDVVKGGYDPVEHYVLYGAAEGRNPSPTFDTRRYLEINPDVAEAGTNPLVHYIKYGKAEERSIDSSI